MIIRELNHVGLFTHNIDESIRFYRDTLGGILIRNSASQDWKHRFIYAQIGAGVVEIIGVAPDARTGFAHVAYLVHPQSLDSAYEFLAGQGFEFTGPPRAALSGVGRLVFYKDISGALFELIQREEDIRKPPFVTDTIASFDGIVINAPADKLDNLRAHYTTELGLESRGTLRGDARYGINDDHLIVRASLSNSDNMEKPDTMDCIDSIALTAAPGAMGRLTDAGAPIKDIGDGLFCVSGPSGERLVFSN
ncbi:hypothetical protein AGMMS49992_05630 [Clostridia bacterium]|nr:hypothetical protein AGMMS49992_05630 [Clostridia bacterium]